VSRFCFRILSGMRGQHGGHENREAGDADDGGAPFPGDGRGPKQQSGRKNSKAGGYHLVHRQVRSAQIQIDLRVVGDTA
jgi:hypothetical protein